MSWKATHRATITPKNGKPKTELIMLFESGGYTRKDWESASGPSWDLDPDAGWFPNGSFGCCSWSVEKLSSCVHSPTVLTGKDQ